MEGLVREPALFNLGLDSKLRGCDPVALEVRDVYCLEASLVDTWVVNVGET